MTSQVEGAHAMLKMYLQVSIDNLLVVYEKITLALENHYQEIKTKFSQEMIRIPHALNKPFYAQVVFKVSTFKSSMVLPCSHVIREFLDNNKCLHLDNFQCQLSQQETPETEVSLRQK
ncbi:13551_t:CDS:2 [Racocetra fulgida]|uniref:13551_t:CDS:1 n=1 Tax=Racocetra fulgida TaxID=60492 RepID=A0A9N9DUB9_9GLOM|nr:13551_t:CDS:2 [Racocetra fulgida]